MTSIVGKVEGLPPGTSKGQLFSSLIEQGGLRKHQIGTIALTANAAEVEIEESLEDLTRLIHRRPYLMIRDQRCLWWCKNPEKEKEVDGLRRELLKSLEFEREECLKEEGLRARLQEVELDHGGQERWTVELFEPQRPLRPWQPIQLLRGEVGVMAQVLRCRGEELEVLVDGTLEADLESKWTLFPLATELPYERMLAALERWPHLQHLWPSAPSSPLAVEVDGLNPEQAQAVEEALNAPIYRLDGPPGTGKTRTLAAIVANAHRLGMRVLACAASHAASDHLARACRKSGVEPLRLGPRQRTQLSESHLVEKLRRDDSCRLARTILDEIPELRKAARRLPPGERREQYQGIDEQRRQAREILARRRRDLVNDAPLLVSTLAHLDPSIYGFLDVDLVVVDEAGQCLQPECMMALVMGRRWILAGDPQQLPATVKVPTQELSISLLERWQQEQPGLRLLEQYRMAPQIALFPNQAFYGGALRNHTSCRGDAPALVFVDTAGSPTQEESKGTSLINRVEMEWVLRECREWLEEGVTPAEIGIISPYRAQCESILDELGEVGVEVKSVDGFQGREKRRILVSLVRANDDGELGFLEDQRRMNVALTRARERLVVIGESTTLCNDAFFSQWMDHLDEAGLLRSWFEWEEA